MSSLPSEPPSSEITPEALYLRRREFLKNGALAAGTALAVGSGLLWLVGAAPPPDAPAAPRVQAFPAQPAAQAQPGQPAAAAPPTTYTVDEPQTPYQSITTYNNY